MPFWLLIPLAITLITIIVIVAAVRSILEVLDGRSLELAVWILIVVAAPIVGAILWWWVGKPHELRHAQR